VQAGTLKSAASVLDRISELFTLSADVTKSSSDLANYSTEWAGLTAELSVLASDAFNGQGLFSTGGGSLTVYLSQDGVQSMTISQLDLLASASDLTAAWPGTAGIQSSLTAVTQAIQNLATLMATNGSESSRVQFAIDSLNVSQVNLEAALSRIYDVDVAAETAKLAKANILVQAGAAMLTQANASQSIALKLLQ